MLLLLISTLLLSASAEDFDKASWLQWKDETYKEHLGSPTSFLNAVSLTSHRNGKTLFLSHSSDPLTTKWEKSRLPGYHIRAANKGDKVILIRPGRKDVTLTAQGRRHHWTLKNGLIAEAVFAATSKKVWGYIYDPKQIKKFTGFRFYPFSKKAVVAAKFKKTKKKLISYKTVQGDSRKVSKIGEVSFKYKGKSFNLNAYNWQKGDEEPNYFALIFSDTKGGKETYAGGREVVVKLSEGLPRDGNVTLDFNRTTNFYCAHSPFWHCPTGLQQKMNVSVDAGEMLPLKKIVQR